MRLCLKESQFAFLYVLPSLSTHHSVLFFFFSKSEQLPDTPCSKRSGVTALEAASLWSSGSRFFWVSLWHSAMSFMAMKLQPSAASLLCGISTRYRSPGDGELDVGSGQSSITVFILSVGTFFGPRFDGCTLADRVGILL